jgi:serine/threonine-protein kinase
MDGMAVKKYFGVTLFIFLMLNLLACRADLTPEPGPTSLPLEIVDSSGVTMRLIPDGDFTMGSNRDDDINNDAHLVSINAFYMDIYEVTNARYADCVMTGICSPPHESKSEFRPEYFGNTQYADFPVVYVDWSMAQTYCEWRDARLPTEAEWEKAARGTDGRTYPWGEGGDCEHANFDGCVGDTSAVGSYTSGVSPYGLYDMAGNVFEWVSSINKSYPYDPTDGREELTGRASRVIRGGGWSHTAHDVQSFYRSWIGPEYYESVIGFRCVRSVGE